MRAKLHLWSSEFKACDHDARICTVFPWHQKLQSFTTWFFQIINYWMYVVKLTGCCSCVDVLFLKFLLFKNVPFPYFTTLLSTYQAEALFFFISKLNFNQIIVLRITKNLNWKIIFCSSVSTCAVTNRKFAPRALYRTGHMHIYIEQWLVSNTAETTEWPTPKA